VVQETGRTRLLARKLEKRGKKDRKFALSLFLLARREKKRVLGLGFDDWLGMWVMSAITCRGSAALREQPTTSKKRFIMIKGG
jgi:hypothetical protein